MPYTTSLYPVLWFTWQLDTKSTMPTNPTSSNNKNLKYHLFAISSSYCFMTPKVLPSFFKNKADRFLMGIGKIIMILKSEYERTHYLDVLTYIYIRMFSQCIMYLLLLVRCESEDESCVPKQYKYIPKPLLCYNIHVSNSEMTVQLSKAYYLYYWKKKKKLLHTPKTSAANFTSSTFFLSTCLRFLSFP